MSIGRYAIFAYWKMILWPKNRFRIMFMGFALIYTHASAFNIVKKKTTHKMESRGEKQPKQQQKRLATIAKPKY